MTLFEMVEVMHPQFKSSVFSSPLPPKRLDLNKFFADPDVSSEQVNPHLAARFHVHRCWKDCHKDGHYWWDCIESCFKPDESYNSLHSAMVALPPQAIFIPNSIPTSRASNPPRPAPRYATTNTWSFQQAPRDTVHEPMHATTAAPKALYHFPHCFDF